MQKHQQVVKERLRKEERRIIKDFTATGQIEPKGINSMIRTLRTAAFLAEAGQQALVIANAATAAAIRKAVDRAAVEVIVTPAVETGTAYLVTDKNLKQQLLAGIEKRGY